LKPRRRTLARDVARVAARAIAAQRLFVEKGLLRRSSLVDRMALHAARFGPFRVLRSAVERGQFAHAELRGRYLRVAAPAVGISQGNSHAVRFLGATQGPDCGVAQRDGLDPQTPDDAGSTVAVDAVEFRIVGAIRETGRCVGRCQAQRRAVAKAPQQRLMHRDRMALVIAPVTARAECVVLLQTRCAEPGRRYQEDGGGEERSEEAQVRA
jgi:hypothetical protein